MVEDVRRTGDLLVDRYRRRGSLGSGSMGDVWLADDLVLGRVVAIKQIRTDARSGADPTAVERMVREARLAARLQHRGIVGVHDLVTVGGQPYVIMQFIDGESLAERLRRRHRLTPHECAELLSSVAAGLDLAHRNGIIHRDVKPANIMIDADGEAKLADFGIARSHNDADLTGTGQMIGTLAYMAPEIARAGEATAASDVWSLGATMYTALEGHAPFGKTGSSQMRV